MASAPPGPERDSADGGIPSTEARSRTPSFSPTPLGTPLPSTPPGEALKPRDLAFLKEMGGLGLMGDLDGKALEHIGPFVRAKTPASRRLDLMEAYYGKAVDSRVGAQRRASDRVLVYCTSEDHPATAIVSALIALVPELGPVALERIGLEKDGPLVLRCGDTFAPVLDDYEDQLDTGEIDLRELEDGPETTSVRGIVGALNVLLARDAAAVRMIPLRGDSSREAYVAVDQDTAKRLFDLGYLEDPVFSDLMDFAAW